MRSYSQNPVLAGLTDHKKPERNREETLAKAAEDKRKRDLDASQAMKDHAAARQEVLVKTAKLRAERLAREADSSPAKKLVRARNLTAAKKK